MARILDFGTDGGGIIGADWVELMDDTKPKIMQTPEGQLLYNVWVRPGTPIPCADAHYHHINARWSMGHNFIKDWPFILGEFARVLKPTGTITVVDVLDTSDGEFTVESLKKTFNDAFPAVDGWTVLLHCKELAEYEQIELQAVVYWTPSDTYSERFNRHE